MCCAVGNATAAALLGSGLPRGLPPGIPAGGVLTSAAGQGLRLPGAGPGSPTAAAAAGGGGGGLATVGVGCLLHHLLVQDAQGLLLHLLV
jgi:hypothetical protein